VFDGQHRKPRTKPRGLFFGLLVVAILAGAVWLFLRMRESEEATREPRPVPPSTRIVTDRPGGSRRARNARVSEAEAVRLLRRHLVEQRQIRNECLAMVSHGSRDGGYTFTVVNSCDEVRLGRWRVNIETGAVSPAR
jgi:hypothetical protein